MEILKSIQRNNLENLGKYFLKKATTFCSKKEFGISYEFFKEGLDLLTCDCNDGWRKEFEILNEDIFFSDIKENISLKAYLFVKAYIVSYEDSLKKLYVALDSIDKYLEFSPDQYGFYVKGRILLALKEEKSALIEFSNAQKIENCHRLEYRIGRVKCQFLNTNGLQELFKSFCTNPSSYCCARILKQNLMLENIHFELPPKCENPLLQSFVKQENEYVFSAKYSIFLKNELVNPVDIMVDPRNNIEEFVYYLKSKTHLFIENIYTNENYIPEENFHTEEENIRRINDSDILLSLELEDIEMEYYAEDYESNEIDTSYYYYEVDDYTSASDSPHYNDNLDMDQQSPEFWDSL